MNILMAKGNVQVEQLNKNNFMVVSLGSLTRLGERSNTKRVAAGPVVEFVPPTPMARVRFRTVACGFSTLPDGMTSVIVTS